LGWVLHRLKVIISSTRGSRAGYSKPFQHIKDVKVDGFPLMQ
jgi:hypothetical protein